MIPDYVPVINEASVCASHGNTVSRSEGCSQHTRCLRPHVRHSYWPCEGHMGSVCINLHQKSAIRARVGFIDPHLLPRRMVSRLTFRSTCAAV